MCRIWGISYGPKGPDGEHINPQDLAENMFEELVSGGTDAFGWALFDGDSIHTRCEVGMFDPVEHANSMQLIDGFSPQWMVGHTRFATTGSAEDARNAHPLWHHEVVGIHNGMVSNYRKLMRRWDRYTPGTEVDSEAIFAAIHHLGDEDGLNAVEGSMAVAYANLHAADELVLARSFSSPLWIGATKNESLIFASTSEAIYRSGLDIIWAHQIASDFVYARVLNGQLTQQFKHYSDRVQQVPAQIYPGRDWLEDGFWEHEVELEGCSASVLRGQNSMHDPDHEEELRAAGLTDEEIEWVLSQYRYQPATSPADIAPGYFDDLTTTLHELMDEHGETLPVEGRSS